MAVAGVAKTVSGASAVQTHSSASVTFDAGHLYLALLATRTGGGTPDDATLGTTGTWTLIDGTTADNRRTAIFRYQPASSTTGAVSVEGLTIDTWLELAIVDVTGFLTGGTNGSAAIGQFKYDQQYFFDEGSPFVITTDTAPAAGSGMVGLFHFTGAALTAGTGFTQLQQDTTSTEAYAFTEFKASGDQTVDATWTGDANLFGYAVEILAAVASEDHSGAAKATFGLTIVASGAEIQVSGGVAQIGLALGVFAEGSGSEAAFSGGAIIPFGLIIRGAGSQSVGDEPVGASSAPVIVVGPAVPPPLPRFQFLVEDIPSGRIKTQTLGLDDWSYDATLNRPGLLSGKVALTSPDCTEEMLDPYRTAIYPMRDGGIEEGYILLPPTLGLGDQALTVNAFGWFGYWDRRKIRKDYIPIGVDQFLIVAQLISDAQDETVLGDGFDLGITVEWDALSGVLRDRTDDYLTSKTKTLGEALQQLAASEDGFDMAMRYRLNTETNRIDKALRLSYPRKGRTTNFLFEYERGRRTNVLRRGFGDSREFAWVGDGWGSGEGDIRLRAPYVDESLRGIYPPYDAAPSWSEVSVQATLDEHTASWFAHHNRPRRTPVLHVDPNMYPRWGDWETGDVIGVRIIDGYGSTDGVVPQQNRITGWKVSSDGTHEIVLADPEDSESV